jgi:phage-related baseplate assembly protein
MARIKPVFVPVNPDGILAEMKAYYEDALNRKLQPADIEMIIIQGFAYRESLQRNALNDTAVLNLLEYAVAPIIDYLGDLVAVTRIPAVPATCDILLAFAGNTTPTVVPEGTRIGAQDQKVFFRTIENVEVPANIANVTVKAACDTEGLIGNGYAPGEINLIIDPLPYLVTASNSDVTAAGAEEETDDRLRERIKLAPSSFSTAGPTNAYKFWALTANPLIVDVAVPKIPLTPGEVRIYPLMESGEVTPTEILDAVLAAVDPEDRRPLCDTPVVFSPDRLEYTLNIELTLFEDAIVDDVLSVAIANAQAFVTDKRRKLGRDIIATQIISAVTADLSESIYNVDLGSFVNIIVDEKSFAFCTAVNVTIVGINVG